MMLTVEMLSELRGPTSPGANLRCEIGKQEGDKIIEGELTCEATGEAYPVRSGVPNFIPRSVLTSSEWKIWQDHIDGLQERRKQREKDPERLVNRFGTKYGTQSPFAKFTGITEGKILDVGCGPGKFRLKFDSDNVEYYGLDPSVVPGIDDFPFVCALSEYIPFKEDMFSHIVVLAALDHFNNLSAFLKEAVRVLKPDGQLHIMQSIHEVRGPISAVKMLTHELKDMVEDRATKIKNSDAPKHITEFSTSTLKNTLGRYFKVEAVSNYSSKWYTPTKLFISLSPLAE